MAKKDGKKRISNNDAKLLSGGLGLIQVVGVAILALIASYAFSVITSASYALGYSVVECAPNCRSDKYLDLSNTVNAQLNVLESASLVVALAVSVTFILELMLLKKLNLKKIVTVLVIALVFILATHKAESIYSNILFIAL